MMTAAQLSAILSVVDPQCPIIIDGDDQVLLSSNTVDIDRIAVTTFSKLQPSQQKVIIYVHDGELPAVEYNDPDETTLYK